MPSLKEHETGEAERARVTEMPHDVAPHEIERSLKRGAVWALGSQIGAQVVRLIGVVVLARLLAPDDYGAAAIAVTLSSFSAILGDLGYGTALVQAVAASRRWVSTAFWSAIGAGVACSACAALGAYPAALVLGEPNVAALVIVGGLTLLLVAVGSTSHALLTRSMSFGIIQGATLVAALASTAAAVALAALGAGPWALVLQQVVLAAVTACTYLLAARWRPSFEFSGPAFRSLSRFAMPVTGGHVLALVQPLFTALLIGHLLSVDALGIWTLSMAIVIVPVSLLGYPLARVVYAAFARMRDRPDRVAELWLTGLTLLAVVVLPALFGLIAVAPDVVPLAFGSHWTAAVPVVQVLSVFLMARTLQTWNTPVMDAAGKPHISTILNAAIVVALIPAIWFGSQFGIVGVAVAFSLAVLLFGELPSFVITTRELSLRGLDVLARLQGIVLASIATCVAVIVLRDALEAHGWNTAARLAVSIVVGIAVYGCSAMLLARGVVLEAFGTARSLRDSARS